MTVPNDAPLMVATSCELSNHGVDYHYISHLCFKLTTESSWGMCQQQPADFNQQYCPDDQFYHGKSQRLPEWELREILVNLRKYT